MNETTVKLRRRWFRFSLRTMFVVVTVFSLWLGWQAKIVRDRKEALVEFKKFGLVHMSVPEVKNEWTTSIPFWRVWMGDSAVSVLNSNVLHELPPEKEDEYRSLFPEAEFWDQPKLILELMQGHGRRKR